MKRQPGSFAPAGTLIRRGRGVTPITEGPAADAAWGAGASMMASAGTNGDESPGPPRLDTPDRHHPRDPDRVASPAADAAPCSRPQGEDAAIDRAVREVIAPVLDGRSGRVSILVWQARVSLEGCVPSADLREAVGRVAGQCPGVVGVDNRIEIEPGTNAPLVLTPERRVVTHSPKSDAKPAPRKPPGNSR